MMSASVARGKELPRKTLHFTTAIIPFALAFGAPLGITQRMIAIALVALFGVACVVEFARRRSPAVAAQFDSAIGVMLRPHEVTNGITGATWLLASFALVCLAAPAPIAIAATWAGAMGDSTAAMVGTAWRLARGGNGKTLIGSATCACVSAAGAWWLAGFPPTSAAVIGLAAAAVERPSVALDDNVRVTVGTALAALLVTLLLPLR